MIKNFFALLVGLLSAMVFVFVVKKVYFEMNPKVSIVEERTEAYTFIDPLSGFRPKSNIKIQTQRFVSEKKIYDVEYEFGAMGERVTPTSRPTTRTQHLILIGGSNTFGEGVEPNETSAFFLGEKFTDYQPYNFAFRGHGPHNFLARLINEDFSLIKGGVALYFFYPKSHVRRVWGDSLVLAKSGSKMPQFRMEEGVLKLKGLFSEHSKLRVKFFRWLHSLPGLSNGEIRFPIREPQEAKVLFCEVLKKIEKTLQERFQTRELVIVIGPKGSIPETDLPLCLNNGRFKSFKIRHHFTQDELKKMKIPGDGHWNAYGNKKIVEVLLSDQEFVSLF